MLTLLRCSTGEEWNIIMYDLEPAFEYAYLVSKVYLCSFVMISSFIMLNMFIMVIIQLFDDFYINAGNIINEWNDKETDF